MTIEITKPETAALIQRYLQSGQFHDIDELLTTALGALTEPAAHLPVKRLPSDLLTGEKSRAAKATNLMELFEPIRGLLTDEEVDTLFSRNPSTGRPVDLA